MTEPTQPDDGARPPADKDMYAKLRAMVLHLDPADVGLSRDPSATPVWGAVMDTGYPNGTATLVCLRDGTTSLYTSTGGGVIGGGGHEQVAEAAAIFLTTVEAYVGDLAASTEEGLPAAGWVSLRALTYDGVLLASALEDDLGYERHVLAPVFYAAQDVLTQLRLIDERSTG